MRIQVQGAGIIGLACADELIRRGHEVTVIDPTPGRGASYAAAGMLTPAAEVWHGEEALLDLGARSLALWPAFAAALGVQLSTGGTLLVGYDAGDRELLRRQLELVTGHGGEARLVDPVAVDPAVSARALAGALLDEPAVDPRLVLAALLDRVETSPRPRSGAPSPDLRVVATGARLPEPLSHLIRGVRGEIVRAHTADPPRQVVRGWVRGRPVYVVPRPGGDVVIGATMEEHDGPPVVSLGGLQRLLADARELVPSLEGATFTEAIARDRPATPDNLPVVGPTGHPGLLVAGGHFRHGVLLAPLTARLLADHIETGRVDPVMDPRRFG